MDFASLGALAVWLAVAATGLALVMAISGSVSRGRSALTALVVAAFASVLATAVLATALISGDFSLAYVAETTSHSTPAPYRVAALWGATEGSLLFLATLLAAVAAAGSWVLYRRRSDLLRPSLAVMALVVGAMLVAAATFGSPFVSLGIPAIEGRGLLAILRHPAMLAHPPILYLGHTTLLVPFAITIAALITDRVDRMWLQLVRNWLMVSWTALTFGMVGGSMWAYVELGWGGFWAWDSVENSALLPWLATTVFLHTSRVQQRTGRLVRWNAALAILPFLLTIFGIYLTRSGLTGSVHAFAESPAVGRFTLALLTLVVVVGVVSLVRYSTSAVGWRLTAPGERWYAANSLVLGWTLLVVAVGSAYPLLSRMSGDSVTVSPRWYVAMLFPTSLIVLGGIALAPRAPAARVSALRKVAGWFVGLTIAVGLSLVVAGVRPIVPVLLLAPAAAAALVVGFDLVRNRAVPGRLVGTMAHLGVALVLLGAAGSALGAEYHGGVTDGDVLDVGGYAAAIGPITTGETDGFSFVAVEVALTRGGHQSGELRTEWRGYQGSVRPTPEPALRPGLRDDVVVAISRVSEDGSVVWLDLFVRPLVVWVWLGSLLIGLSGLLGLARTVGSAAARRRQAITKLQLEETTAGTSNS